MKAQLRAADLARAKIGPRIGSSVQVCAGLCGRGRLCVALRQRGREGRSPACRRRRDRVSIYDAGSAAGRFLAGRRSMEAGMNIVTLSIASREEVSRRASAAVHGDVTALLHAGILDQAEAGVVFPYDAVHVDFTLTTAA